LGLGEKMRPRLMAQAKMAEMDEWKDLRQEIVDGHQELLRLLREQMDEDLAVLVDIGAWMRSLEIVSKLVIETPEVDKRHLCIGSPALLAEMRQDFASLSDVTRRSALLQPLIEVLTELVKTWGNPKAGAPTQSMVARTHEAAQQCHRRADDELSNSCSGFGKQDRDAVIDPKQPRAVLTCQRLLIRWQAMTRQIRIAEAALGTVTYDRTAKELDSLAFRRSIFVSRDVSVGAEFTSDNLRIVRPGHGLPPRELDRILGRRARTSLRAGTPLSWDHVA